MIRFYFILCFLFVEISFSQSCPPSDTLLVNSIQNSWDIPNYSNWSELEVMTWNLKEFPQTSSTINDVQEIITDMLPDIINFQELSNTAFNELEDMIPSYGFIKTTYTQGFNSNFQLGIAYRKDCIELLNYSILFSDNAYPFANRPPLKADFIWSCGEISKSFQMINIHFKCCDDGFSRRLEASEILNSYLNEEYSNNNFVNIIVAGDFNDSLDDPQNNNSLWPLISSNSLYFVDNYIANGASQDWSYPSWPSHIDHILINQNLFDENEAGGITSTILIDDYTGYSYYQNNISDHRPVIWKTRIEQQNSINGLVINEIMNNPNSVSDSFGEWFEIINISDSLIDLYGLVIKDQDTDFHMINEHLLINSNELLVLGTSSDQTQNGNITVDYEYTDFNLSNTWDEIIIIDQNENIIDEVYYDYGEIFPNNQGVSMELINPYLNNNVGNNWLQSDMAIGNGDYGTPGFQNNSCQPSGDSNLDNTINVVDIVFTVGYILGNQEFNNYNFCEADIDTNGIINVIDIVSLINYILKGN